MAGSGDTIVRLPILFVKLFVGLPPLQFRGDETVILPRSLVFSLQNDSLMVVRMRTGGRGLVQEEIWYQCRYHGSNSIGNPTRQWVPALRLGVSFCARVLVFHAGC